MQEDDDDDPGLHLHRNCGHGPPHGLRRAPPDPRREAGHVLLGPTDCIALVECPDHTALHKVIPAIRAVPGVVSTDTRYIYA